MALPFQTTAPAYNSQAPSVPTAGGGGGGGGWGTSQIPASQIGTTYPTYKGATPTPLATLSTLSDPTQTASTDPAAAAAAQKAADGTALFNTQLGVVNNSAGMAATNSAGDLKNSILDYIDSLKANQTGRNNQTVQNYLAKQQGAQGINDMVGQGIRSAGVQLNNGNAGDSSAAGAIAGAYGQLGRSQLSSVGNQFAQAQNTVQQGADADQVALAAKLRDLPQTQSDIVNSIVSDAQQKLGAIDQQMAYMSLPDRVDMEAQKQQITNDVLGKLQGFDQILSSGGNQALTPQDQGTSVQKAGQLFTAGTAPDNAFNFNTNAPAVLQGSGAQPGALPIYTSPAAKKQIA